MNAILYKVFILLLIIISLPLVTVIGIAIVLSSGLPTLFRQKRVGKDGKPFTMYKFRTMVVGAEKLKKKFEKLNEANGPAFKIHNDPRFTPFGRFLSHTGLDELPQLINVLKGDMALIGPRPLPTPEVASLKGWQKERHTVKPGIISPWILNGYHNNSFDSWMRSDIKYARHKSLAGDALLCAKSIALILQLFVNEVKNIYYQKYT